MPSEVEDVIKVTLFPRPVHTRQVDDLRGLVILQSTGMGADLRCVCTRAISPANLFALGLSKLLVPALAPLGIEHTDVIAPGIVTAG